VYARCGHRGCRSADRDFASEPEFREPGAGAEGQLADCQNRENCRRPAQPGIPLAATDMASQINISAATNANPRCSYSSIPL